MERKNFEASVVLPSDFAENLLELEMQVEKNCEVDTIKSLVNLYSAAIEFYESVKDPKYVAYHKRLQSLLLRDDVQTILNSTVKATVRKPLTSLNVNSMKNAETQLIESSNEAHISKHQVLDNIKNQEDRIELKMIRRKSLRNPVSVKIEGDRSAGSLDWYESSLIEVMEKYLTDKITKTQEIKNTYHSQMQEIKQMGTSPMILEILIQMQQSMENEIAELCKEIDKEKNVAISKIKNGNLIGMLKMIKEMDRCSSA